MFDPTGGKKFEKKTEEVPDASEKGPGELPRPKMRPTKSGDGLQRSPGTPEAPQKPKKAIFGCSKAFFGSPQGTPLAKQWRRTNSVI